MDEDLKGGERIAVFVCRNGLEVCRGHIVILSSYLGGRSEKYCTSYHHALLSVRLMDILPLRSLRLPAAFPFRHSDWFTSNRLRDRLDWRQVV